MRLNLAITLQGQAKLIARYFESAGNNPLQLPETIAPYYRHGTGEFVILSPYEKILASSNGIKQPLHPIDPQKGREFFSYSQREGQPPYHGISLRIKRTSEPLWVQVVFKDNEVIFDSVLEEFVQDIAWIWLPFVVILLVINLIVIRIGLRPLVLASEQASKIGPAAVFRRLPEEGMPAEVLSFVKAINQALDRLEDGYKAQQAFIADAAHELRTPVTVMFTHMDMLPSFHGKAALKDEIYGLKRLVSQLLDSARCDSIQIEPSSKVELNTLAADVASYLAPWAISIGKTVEVFEYDRAITINGDYDFLFRALRNLVENAIEHTKPGSAASIFVRSPAIVAVADRGPGVPLADREHIFERFWQGSRDRNSGAGTRNVDHCAHCRRAPGHNRSRRPAPGRSCFYIEVSSAQAAVQEYAHRTRPPNRGAAIRREALAGYRETRNAFGNRLCERSEAIQNSSETNGSLDRHGSFSAAC